MALFTRIPLACHLSISINISCVLLMQAWALGDLQGGGTAAACRNAGLILIGLKLPLSATEGSLCLSNDLEFDHEAFVSS